MRGKGLFPWRTTAPNPTFIGLVRWGKVTEDLEARGGIEPPIKVLQTFALPLGDRALEPITTTGTVTYSATNFLPENKSAHRRKLAMGSKEGRNECKN